MLLTSALVIGGTGLVCGASLAVVARIFAVYEDPRIEKASSVLPGVNCGGCGYAGCADYAKAVVSDGASVTLCAPGGDSVVADLSALLGVSAETSEPKVAIVLCGGDREKATTKFKYNGIADCNAAAAVGGGEKACSYGCLGYGSCSRVCPVGAIEITQGGLAVVHPGLCIGCAACVKACPRSLIKLVPESKTIHVMCSSRDKGPIVKKACSVGCIGCRVCTKFADEGSIEMDGFLAVVDYSKPLTSSVVVEKCPGKCIVEVAGTEDSSLSETSEETLEEKSNEDG